MKNLTLLFSIMMLVGCGTLKTKEPTEAASTDKPKWEQQTRVYAANQCIVSSSKKTEASAGAAVLGILIQGVAESALSSLGSWVSKLGDAEKKQYSARSEIALYEWDLVQRRLVVNSELNCLIVVSGKFAPSDKPKPGSYTFTTKFGDAFDPETNTDNEINADVRMTRLADNNINVKDITLLYEASIEPSSDKTAFRLVSRYLEIGKLQSGLDSAGLVIGLSIDGPSNDGSANTLTGSLMSFGKITPGTLLVKEGLSTSAYDVDGTKYFKKGKGDRSGLLIFPPVNPNSAAVFQSQVSIKNAMLSRRDVLLVMIGHVNKQMVNDSVSEADKLEYAKIGTELRKELTSINTGLSVLTQTTEFMPVELSASITETGDENKALKFIGKVLESKSQDLATAVTTAISPEARGKAEEEENTKQQTLEATMEQAEVALLGAELEKQAFDDSGESNEIKARLLALKVEVAKSACERAQTNLGAAGRCQ